MHNDFVLFGGTALALQIGHRKSVDLDLIKEDNFLLNDIRNKLKKNYNFNELRQSENILIGEIDSIKVAFVFEENNLLELIVMEDGIRLLSVEDICAMKLMSISDNGSRLILTDDIRLKYKDIPWKAITGFRDVAAHKYEALNMKDVYDTVKDDFPILAKSIEKILSDDPIDDKK